MSRATPLGREHGDGSGWQLCPKSTHSSSCSDLTVDSTKVTALFLVTKPMPVFGFPNPLYFFCWAPMLPHCPALLFLQGCTALPTSLSQDWKSPCDTHPLKLGLLLSGVVNRPPCPLPAVGSAQLICTCPVPGQFTYPALEVGLA